MKKIGLITVGQSPRDDVLAVMRPHLPAGIEILQRGALDEFDRSTVKALEPAAGQTILVSVMRDGTEVKMSHEKVVTLMQNCVNELVQKGAECIVLLCTWDFEELQADRLIIRSGKLARGLIRALTSETSTRLGVVLPSADQIPGEKGRLIKRWGGLDVFITSASPYAEPEARAKQWKRAAEDLTQANVDLVYLDCIGMDEGMKRVIQQETRKPVVLASSTAARMVSELVGG